MRPTVEREGNRMRLTLVGSAHLGGLPDLEQTLRTAVADGNVGDDVTIDLDGLTAIHDAAIGLLGGTIVDINAKRGVAQVICQHGPTLDRILAISKALS